LSRRRLIASLRTRAQYCNRLATMSRENVTDQQRHLELLAGYRPGSELARAVGARIRTERLAVGLTQTEAARLLGISRPFLSGIEHGHRVASPDLLRAICRWRGADVSELLFGPEQDTEVAEPVDAYSPTATRLPVVGRASADPLTDMAWDPIDPPEWLEIPRAARLIEVRGDSMRPLAWPGQHVIVLPERPNDGDLAVVQLRDGRLLFKRIWWAARGRRASLLSLRAEEPEPPIEVPAREIARLWRVIGVLYV